MENKKKKDIDKRIDALSKNVDKAIKQADRLIAKMEKKAG